MEAFFKGVVASALTFLLLAATGVAFGVVGGVAFVIARAIAS